MTYLRHPASRLVARAAVLLAVPAIVFTLSGCSPASGTPSSSVSESTNSRTYATYQADFSQCLRDEGLNLPDTAPGETTEMDMATAEAFQRASATCTKKLGDPPTQESSDSVDQGDAAENALKIAECLRDAGYDVPDPSSDGMLSLPANIPDSALTVCAPKA